MLRLKQVGNILKGGGVGVLPTDTIYGVVGSALDKKAVARIYELRRRNPKKPMIILVGDMRQATWDKFGVKPGRTAMKILKKFWPGKVSVILATKEMRRVTWRRKWEYLHRGTNTLAIRLPKPNWLRRLLAKTGPLVAPSANWEGYPPAKTVQEAKKYFGKNVDFYLNAGRLNSKPSTLIKIEGGKAIVLRKGAAKA